MFRLFKIAMNVLKSIPTGVVIIILNNNNGGYYYLKMFYFSQLFLVLKTREMTKIKKSILFINII